MGYYCREKLLQVRAAHEANVMCRVLDQLEFDQVILVADWKMK